MNKITSSLKKTDRRGCPFRDKISVENRQPTTTCCPDRDNILIEHIAYLTARSCLRGYSISIDIAFLKGCCAAKNENEVFILSEFKRIINISKKHE